MATTLGHGIAGMAIAKSAGMGPRGMAVGFVLANSPDLDLLLGLVVEGDAGAFHRDWWSHSPAAAILTAAIAFAAYTFFRALRHKPMDLRRSGGVALFVGLLVLSHTILDFVIINPAVLLPEAGTDNLDNVDNLLRAAGRQLLAYFSDFLFYGAISLLLYRRYLRVRQHRQERPASPRR